MGSSPFTRTDEALPFGGAFVIPGLTRNLVRVKGLRLS